MTKFILNNQTIEIDLPKGETVLDFVRYRKNLKGTKIGCREGDCGACAVLVGESENGSVRYRSMTACLMPLANADGKHIVTIEGVNKPNDELTEVQRAMVDCSGTQCGFCTVGFVMSLTGFCLDDAPKTDAAAIASIDGNICRCTGYKSIERAAAQIGGQLSAVSSQKSPIETAIEKGIVPDYFAGIKNRLEVLKAKPDGESPEQENQAKTHAAKFGVEDKYNHANLHFDRRVPQFVGGGTDLYVQRPEEMVYAATETLFDNPELRFVEETSDAVEIGASATVTDLFVSPVFQRLFPHLEKHLKLISSTPIRNMATVAGNFINASPIGDMTAWFLALDAVIVFNNDREIPLRELYLGYKTLAKTDDEFVTKIRFARNFTHFNFEKVSKRIFLDISTVNTAMSLNVENNKIIKAHVSAGGVAPVPLYLPETSRFLRGKEISSATISQANEILQTEISPISDVRGTESYKRLLLKQLFTAHFVELFGDEL